MPGKFFDSDRESENALRSLSWFLSKLEGVSTITLHNISPLLLSLTIDAPLPLILKIFPVCVWAGIFNEIDPSPVRSIDFIKLELDE